MALEALPDNPLVTIVTPSYNQGPFIRATIESVLRQDYPHIEYIIMDGGSTDETAAVVKEYSSRLTWISEKDRGQSHAINKGFRMARGQVLAWLNSDDIFLDGAVSTAVRALREFPEAAAIYGEGYLIDRSGNITGRFPYSQPFNLWLLVYLSDYVLQQTVFFRRFVFDEVGYLDEDLHYSMDWDLLIRIGKRYPLAFIPEYLGCLREYPEAKSFSGGKRRVREIRRMLQLHTGMRYPPGYILYGLDTHRLLWCNAVQRWTPSILQRPSESLQTLVQLVACYFIGRVVQHSQGWYQDGWAGTRMKYMLPAWGEAVKLRGSLPEVSRFLHGQSIEVFCNGRNLGKYRVPTGEFEIIVPLQGVPQGAGAEFLFRASRFFVPAFINGSADHRRLAYIVNQICWAGADVPRALSPVRRFAATPAPQ